MVRKGSGYFEVSLLSRDVGERAAHAAGVWGRYRNVDLISLVSSYIIVPTDQTRLKMFMLELFFFLKICARSPYGLCPLSCLLSPAAL